MTTTTTTTTMIIIVNNNNIIMIIIITQPYPVRHHPQRLLAARLQLQRNKSGLEYDKS